MGRTLKEWRMHKHLSQLEASKNIGVAVSTYNKWENNPGKMQIEDALKVANGFKVDIDDIIFFDDKSNLKYVLNVEKEISKWSN